MIAYTLKRLATGIVSLFVLATVDPFSWSALYREARSRTEGCPPR